MLASLTSFVCSVILCLNSASFAMGPFLQTLLWLSNPFLFFPQQGTPLILLGTSLQTSGKFVITSFSTLTLSSWIGPPHCPLGPRTGMCDILTGHSVCIAKPSLWLWSYNFCCWISYVFISFVIFVVNSFIEVHIYDSSLRVCSENVHLRQFPWGHWPVTWRQDHFKLSSQSGLIKNRINSVLKPLWVYNWDWEFSMEMEKEYLPPSQPFF